MQSSALPRLKSTAKLWNVSARSRPLIFFQGDQRRDRAVINNVDTSFKSFFLEHVIELAQQDES